MRKHHFPLDSFTPLQNITYYRDISSIDDGLEKQYKHNDDRNYHQSKSNYYNLNILYNFFLQKNSIRKIKAQLFYELRSF